MIRSTAIGTLSMASGDNTIGMGFQSSSLGANGIAIGNTSQVNSTNGLAVGTNAVVAANDPSGTPMNNGIAIGNNSRANNSDATAVGANAIANGQNSVAFGTAAQRDKDRRPAPSARARVRSAATRWHWAPRRWRRATSAPRSARTRPRPVRSASRSASRPMPRPANRWQSATMRRRPASNSSSLGRSANASQTGALALGADIVGFGRRRVRRWSRQRRGRGGQHRIRRGIRAAGPDDTAIGSGAQVLANQSTAVGADSVIAVGALQSSAFGATSNISAAQGTALGFGTNVSTIGGVAIGSGAVANRAIAPATGSIPVGSGSTIFDTTDKTLLGAVSVGTDTSYRQITNVADGTQAQDAVTIRQLQGAIGSVASSPAMYFHANSAAGDSLAVGAEAIAVGPLTVVNADNGIGMGNGAVVDLAAPGGIAIGRQAQVLLASGVAMGTQAQANAEQGVALGAGASADHALSVALGSSSQTTVGAETGYTAFGLTAAQTSFGEVSIGSAGAERKLTNLAAGSADTDAVNVAQLKSVQAVASDALLWDPAANGGVGAFSASHAGSGPNKIVNLGAGLVGVGSTEAINGGQLYAAGQTIASILGGSSQLGADGAVSVPGYNLGGNVFNNIGQALAYLNGLVGSGGGGADARFTAQDTTAAAATGTGSVAAGSNAQATAANSVALGANSVADRANTVSVGAAGNERQVANVAAGTAATDAVNVQQMQTQAVTTLNQANTYTDQRVSEVVSIPMQAIEDLRGDVEDEFRHTDRRINRHGAMNAAMIHMASSAANIQTRNRVSVGAGYSEGQEAMAVGYQRQIKRNVSFSLGAAFSGSEQSAGVGLGVGW